MMRQFNLGFFLALVTLGFSNASFVIATEAGGGEQDGISLLAEAVRYAGSNPKVVRSGRVLLNISRKSEGTSEEQFRRDLDAQKKFLEKRIASLPENDRNRRLFAKQLETAEEDLRKVQAALTNQNYRCQIVFGTAPGQFQDVKQTLYSRVSTNPDVWKVQYVLVGGLKDVKTRTFLQLIEDRKEVRVECNKWGIDQIYEFGRIRGQRAAMWTAVLLLNSDKTINWNYEINEETVQELRRVNKTLQKEKTDVGIRIAGTTSFEGEKVSIVEVLSGQGGGKWVVWVDPSRGYICPRIEEYVRAKLKHLYLSTGYYLEQKSGLWWPRTHVATTYSPNGDIQVETTYAMTPEATAINVPVDPKEYVLPVKAGFHVIDDRNSKPLHYMVAQPTDLRLVKGEIDLSDSKIFMPDQPAQATVFESNSWRPYAIAVSLFLIVLLLFTLYWRHRRRVTV